MVFNFSKREKKFNKRKLSDRSHLTFEFPVPEGRAIRAYLPMLENCQVSESQKAKLTEYALLGRNSSIYAYQGAGSRTFNINFRISLLHILEEISKEGIDDRFKQEFTVLNLSKEAKIDSFFSFSNSINKKEHARIHREYYQKIAKLKNQKLGLFDNTLNSVFSSLGLDSFLSSDPSFDSVNKAIDLIIYWVNLVRSSTKNNSKNTTLGCPLVRLTHGTMYNNIPCVVDSYSIRIVDESGYDVQTLTPKQIEISMVLNENRVGNFDDFISGVEDGDNNTGWEAVFSENNMDPYNGLIK